MHEHLSFWARTYPDRPAASDGVRTWTYAEMECRANQFGHALRTRGVGNGDRFAVVARNCLEWFAIYYGSFKVGAVPVPLNYRLAPREWIFPVNDSGSALVVAQQEYVQAIETVRARFESVDSVLAIGGAPGWENLEEITDAHPGSCPDVALGPDDELYQMYTSGTTGTPKGAVLTHRAVDAQIAQVLLPLDLAPTDEVLTVMPLFHAGAAVMSMAQIARGACLHVMRDFDAAACVKALDEGSITMATFVPAMIQAMLVTVPDVATREYQRLRLITYGASPIPESTLRQAMDVFGCEFLQAYGMTETTACLAMLHPDDHRRALDQEPDLLRSCGRPVVGTEIRVVDSADRPRPTGQVGEIVARGPQLMKGYWNLPEETAAALHGGWMHTGDAGYLDDRGFLYLSDRIKDMIISGGENIYPREIEDVIFDIPAVADCAVIGVPDDEWGETVKAVVVRREGEDLSVDEVIQWCTDRLARYKRPRYVEFVDALPRNPSGKVLKRELRAAHRAIAAHGG